MTTQRRTRSSSQRPTTVSTDNVRRILSTCYADPKKHDLGDVVRVLANTGLRVGELRDLTWACVDFANSRIAVASAKLRSNRYVTIGPKTILLLKARKDRQQASEFVFGENRLALFNRMLHQLPEFVKRSDAGSVSFHCLRHMFAARVVSAGASPFTLFLILGYVLGYSTLSFASSPNRQFEEAARSLALLEEF